MISMLILAIVCISWLQIIGIQSARKEARRREAVERLAGIMDAFMYTKWAGDPKDRKGRIITGYYKWEGTNVKQGGDASTVLPLFDNDESPIGYQLCVVENGELPTPNQFATTWGSPRWLVGKLYDWNGAEGDVRKPFFTLFVCLGW